MVKFKVRNWLKDECGKQIAFIPSICFFWGPGIRTIEFVFFIYAFQI